VTSEDPRPAGGQVWTQRRAHSHSGYNHPVISQSDHGSSASSIFRLPVHRRSTGTQQTDSYSHRVHDFIHPPRRSGRQGRGPHLNVRFQTGGTTYGNGRACPKSIEERFMIVSKQNYSTSRTWRPRSCSSACPVEALRSL